jgi:hypothetical protein
MPRSRASARGTRAPANLHRERRSADWRSNSAGQSGHAPVRPRPSRRTTDRPRPRGHHRSSSASGKENSSCHGSKERNRYAVIGDPPVRRRERRYHLAPAAAAAAVGGRREIDRDVERLRVQFLGERARGGRSHHHWSSLISLLPSIVWC